MNQIYLVLSLFVTFIALSSQAEIEPMTDPLSICYNFAISPTPAPSENPKCRVIGKTMYWEGEISNHLTHELFQLYPHVTHLELNSYGGFFDDALEAARKIREKGITTNVRKGAFCASACTLIYQAGVERSAHPTARFLYHSSNYSGEAWYIKWQDYCAKNNRDNCGRYLSDLIEKSQQATEALFQVYREYGINEFFFSDYQKQPESKDWFQKGNFSRLSDWLPSIEQLVKYNIVQKLDANP